MLCNACGLFWRKFKSLPDKERQRPPAGTDADEDDEDEGPEGEGVQGGGAAAAPRLSCVGGGGVPQQQDEEGQAAADTGAGAVLCEGGVSAMLHDWEEPHAKRMRTEEGGLLEGSNDLIPCCSPAHSGAAAAGVGGAEMLEAAPAAATVAAAPVPRAPAGWSRRKKGERPACFLRFVMKWLLGFWLGARPRCVWICSN